MTTFGLKPVILSEAKNLILNAADALHLPTALEIHSQLQRQGDSLLFFAADQRLLRAAQTEGLAGFNPETGTAAQLDALLAA
jgi:hypothetical protein